MKYQAKTPVNFKQSLLFARMPHEGSTPAGRDKKTMDGLGQSPISLERGNGTVCIPNQFNLLAIASFPRNCMQKRQNDINNDVVDAVRPQ